jgi:hypothetical protein
MQEVEKNMLTEAKKKKKKKEREKKGNGRNLVSVCQVLLVVWLYYIVVQCICE